MSKKPIYIQGDFLKDWGFKEKTRLSELEEKQNNLRKGLFKRWNDQEKKINFLHEEIKILSAIIEGVLP